MDAAGTVWTGKAMKKLFLLLMGCAIALGGYQLGRQPDSPDVVGWMSDKAGRIDWEAADQFASRTVETGRQGLSDWLSDDPSAAQTATVDPSPAQDTTGEPLSARRQARGARTTPGSPDIPECW